MTLEEKIQVSQEYLGYALSCAEPSRIAVAWTGGKDSTVVLALWLQFLQAQGAQSKSVLALNLDTGVKFPEMLSFRDRIAHEWDVSLTIVRPDVDLHAYPIAEDPVQCCTDLKILPLQQALREMNMAVLLTGIRADEHPERSARSWIEERDNPVHTMINPLIYWTEMDIWAYTLEQGLPYCALYDRGYRSLGCRPCTSLSNHEERSGRNQGKEDMLNILNSLGYF